MTRAIVVESGKELAGWSRQRQRAVETGTPGERIAREAINCAQAAKEDGTNLLYEADDSGKQIRGDHG